MMEDQVKFPPEQDAFYATVKERVQNYFSINRKTKYSNAFFYFKAVVFLSLHTALYMAPLFSDKLILLMTELTEPFQKIKSQIPFFFRCWIFWVQILTCGKTGMCSLTIYFQTS
jgi:hypothetical protein